MITVYRSQGSESARTLAAALAGRRVLHARNAFNRPGQPVVCWGDYLPNVPAGTRVLNNQPVGNKIIDAEKLTAAGVPTITISRTAPSAAGPADDPALGVFRELIEATGEFSDLQPTVLRTAPFRTAVGELGAIVGRLREQLDQPLPPPVEWLARSRNHVGGSDLLSTRLIVPDYWVKREEIAREFRVHSFLGRSIRAGMKTVRDGLVPSQPGIAVVSNGYAHPWIRSYDAGWRVSYDGDSVRQRHRDAAHAAVAALGLDFAAVDVAERPDGSVFVLEVNRAPGIEAGTIEAYARAITRWASAPAAI